MSKEFYGFDDQDFEEAGLSDRKRMIHETIYRSVMHALKTAQPQLPEAGATPIAINAAVRATDEIEKNLSH